MQVIAVHTHYVHSTELLFESSAGFFFSCSSLIFISTWNVNYQLWIHMYIQRNVGSIILKESKHKSEKPSRVERWCNNMSTGDWEFLNGVHHMHLNSTFLLYHSAITVISSDLRSLSFTLFFSLLYLFLFVSLFLFRKF